MRLFGLTGGIGSGKSTVSERLESAGAVIVDADRMVRELQAPGQKVLLDMVDAFGPSIVDADGNLDRSALAQLVFNDDAALARLNAIVHPAVGMAIIQRLDELASTDRIVVLDVPLLVESGQDMSTRFGGHPLLGVIVVDVDPEIAMQRLVQYRGFDPQDVRARMARQANRADRLSKADFVIDNSGDLSDLDVQVERAWQWIGDHTVTVQA